MQVLKGERAAADSESDFILSKWLALVLQKSTLGVHKDVGGLDTAPRTIGSSLCSTIGYS